MIHINQSSKTRIVDSQRDQLFCLRSWEKWTFWRLRGYLSQWRTWFTMQDAGLNPSTHTLSWQWVTRILRLGRRELERLTSHPGQPMSSRCSESPCLKHKVDSDWGSHSNTDLWPPYAFIMLTFTQTYAQTHIPDTQMYRYTNKKLKATKETSSTVSDKGLLLSTYQTIPNFISLVRNISENSVLIWNLDEITVERGRKCRNVCKWGKMANK